MISKTINERRNRIFEQAKAKEEKKGGLKNG